MLRENTLYFPGWSAMVDGQNVPIEFQDINSRGIMTFAVPTGTHKVVVIFAETKLRLLSDVFSLFALLGTGILFILRKRIWRN
jgi:uncharacterized membrane protein YfhO